jgi:hypothetical protein
MKQMITVNRKKSKYKILIGISVVLMALLCLDSCHSTKTLVSDKPLNSKEEPRQISSSSATSESRNEKQTEVRQTSQPVGSNFIDSLKNGKIFYSMDGLDYTDELYSDIPEVFKEIFPNVQYFKHTVLTIPPTFAICAYYENKKYGLSGDFNVLYKKTHTEGIDAPFEKRVLALIYVVERMTIKNIEIKSIQEGFKKIEPPLQYTEFNYEIIAKVNDEITTYYLLFKDNKVYCFVKLINNKYRTAIMPNIY